MPKPQTPPHLITLILLAAFSPLSLNMFLPSLASIADALKADYATVSFAVSGYLATTSIVLLIVGPLSDRIGRRPVLFGALALFAGASLMCALAESVWTFLAFRMLQGGMISGFAISQAIVRDTTPERQAASLIGYIGMSMAIAPMLGPMLGGLLDAAAGWRANFYFYAISGVCLLILCWVDVGETNNIRERAGNGHKESPLLLFRHRRFWAYCGCTAFSAGAFYIFITGAPLVARATFGVNSAELGLYIGSITAGFILGSFLTGRYATRFKPTSFILIGQGLACGGLTAGIVMIEAGFLSPVFYFGSTIFVGLGNGITLPNSNARAMSIRPSLAGSAAGLIGALTVAGGSVLTSLTGFVVADGAASPLLCLMLLSSACGLVSVLWAVRIERNPPS